MAHELSLSFHQWFFLHCSSYIVEDSSQLASGVLKKIKKQNFDEENAK